MSSSLNITVRTERFFVSVVPAELYNRTLVLEKKGKNVKLDVDNIVARVDVSPERVTSVIANKTFITLHYALFGSGGTGAEPKYTNRFEEIGYDSFYFGEASPGSEEDEAVWRIRKIVDRFSDMKTLWAGGTAQFQYKWTDRDNLSYT